MQSLEHGTFPLVEMEHSYSRSRPRADKKSNKKCKSGFCGQNGVCVPSSGLSYCYSDDRYCALNQFCYTQNHICVQKDTPNNKRCGSNNQCLSGQCNLFTNGKCATTSSVPALNFDAIYYGGNGDLEIRQSNLNLASCQFVKDSSGLPIMNNWPDNVLVITPLSRAGVTSASNPFAFSAKQIQLWDANAQKEALGEFDICVIYNHAINILGGCSGKFNTYVRCTTADGRSYVDTAQYDAGW